MSYLERYKAGEFKSVWKEIQSLNLEQAGQRIREDAFDTARETMQRAKWNLNSLIQSLESLGYEFGDEPHNLYFMDYLRLCFSFGGFPGFKNMPLELKNSLTAGFLPF